jgi:type II secretory pathway component PulF
MNAEGSPPSDASKRLMRAVLITPAMFAAHFAALTAVVVFLGSVVPIHFEFFTSLDIELPQITVALLEQMRALHLYWYLAYAVLFLIDGPILFLLQYQSPKLGWLKASWFTGWLLAAIVYLFWGAMSIAVVYKSLLDNLQPSP